MRLAKEIETKTYRTDFKGFYVDIVDDDTLEAWLYHENYGIKELMFGEDGTSILDFKDLVEINLPSYIESYKDKYFDR